MRQLSVMFARFPYGAIDHPDVTDWLAATVHKAKTDPRISDVLRFKINDTPITMGRNRCLEEAKKRGVDILLMVDSDMSPDLPELGAQPFWESSFDFLLQHHGPTVVAAPYCGPPPNSNVYVFRWANWQNWDHVPEPDMRLEQYSREEAAARSGMERVAALPTGLFLMDMRCLAALKPPYFYYEWTDHTESEKASTEDVTFTRDLSLAGIPIYCNWDSWAGHWKQFKVGKPHPISADQVAEKFRDAVARGYKSTERLIHVGEGLSPPPPVRKRSIVEEFAKVNGAIVPAPGDPKPFWEEDLPEKREGQEKQLGP